MKAFTFPFPRLFSGFLFLGALPIIRRILISEGQRSNDPTNATSAHNRGRAKRPAPHASNIVGLVRQTQGDIGLGAADDQKGAKVARAAALCVPQHDDADDFDDAVEEEEGGAEADAVGEDAFCEAEDGGESVALKTNHVSMGHLLHRVTMHK